MGMGVSRRGPCTSLFFIHDTDNLERGLMGLFLGLVFTVVPLPLEILCQRPCKWVLFSAIHVISGVAQNRA